MYNIIRFCETEDDENELHVSAMCFFSNAPSVFRGTQVSAMQPKKKKSFRHPTTLK